MKDRPIIFNSEMVRAILDGRKTQTRRIMKANCMEVAEMDDGTPWPWRENGETCEDYWYPCPFGAVGDRLWVRETFATLGNEDGCAIDWNDNLVKEGGVAAARIYRASCEQRPGNCGLWSIPDDAFWKPHTDDMQYEGSWTPSIHMPRWASRILLEITGVRVEQLQDITESDAIAEGCVNSLHLQGGRFANENFAWLWQSIYGDKSWSDNPWVWVVEFKRVEQQP